MRDSFVGATAFYTVTKVFNRSVHINYKLMVECISISWLDCESDGSSRRESGMK